MRESCYPLERELGIRYYASDADGIGGKLRSAAEDFIVEELPLPFSGGTGPYLVCRLTKKNWELQHAVKEIAKRLGISHRRIGWAGTKDRRAVTTQFISIYRATPGMVANVGLKDITLEVVREQNTQISLGDLQGNRFDIVIRDAAVPGLAGRVGEITRDVATGIPNYYGIQRFGAVRPVTHLVGERILAGDFEGAVLTYIRKTFPLESGTAREVRAEFGTTRDAEAALRKFPVSLGYERAMLQYLHNNPGDYAGALHELPQKLLSMFVSAFQSYLFNMGLSRRIGQGHSLAEPQPGDRLIFANGKEDVVSSKNQQTAAQHIRRGRCGIAIFMPGKDCFVPSSDSEHYMNSLMEERGIGAEDFLQASAFVRTKFKGALRPISLHTDVGTGIEDTSVRLQFTLPPGHYATTVAREYMKADPMQMI
jgi:tRNA pseudouridine13 synthase